ncbi:MAG: fibronectin type III domain-containing protein, partial [Actinomycetota bacterium]|nr:fibronectin type III domain-containing protein [Actinomycetota bacterium]
TSTPSAASNSFMPATVPGAPTIGTATRGNGLASVTFTAPASNGGSAITSYTATCTSTNSGVLGSNSGPGSPITVTGLTNGKTYTCKVTATNAVGTSTPSAASNSFMPATVPAAPTNAKAVPGSTTTATGPLTVSFTPGANNGATITSYTVTCTSSDGGASGSNTGTASPITVTGLTTAKTYTCTVTPTNAVGAGAASAPSLPVIVGSPAAPTNVKAVPGSTTTATGPLTVSFTPGANNGATITSYIATCTSSNSGASGSNTGTASPITVNGLTTTKTYTCTVTATNARGTGLASGPSLQVIVGSPAAPTNVKAVPGSTTTATGPLTVSFTPGANNGAAISNYTVTCTSSNGGASGSNTGTASPITVTGLTTAKTYTCTVTATNTRGAGLASAPSLPVIVGSPAAPTGVSAVKVASGQVKVSFTAGTDNGSAISSFTATCTSSDGGVSGSQTGPASPITVTSLTTAKTYTCTVTATNTRGTSLASPSSTAIVA